MNSSFTWIKRYVPDLDIATTDFVDRMTLSGTKVEGYEDRGADLEKIFVGQIKKIERHPDADKLIICQVDIGEEEFVQIVTGANNVKENDKVPVVLDGGRVACDHDGNRIKGGVKIKKGKLRGIISNGMMCSIQELGSNCDMYPEACADGIYIFDSEVPVGEQAAAILGLNDVMVEYEVTSNRVDCFSMIGIAREVAATFQKDLILPKVNQTGNQEDIRNSFKVSIEDSEKCSRYIARVVKNVKIQPSPLWMQRCLASVGIRPINNIVDITNFVMEEMGQPMHSYDLRDIEGNEIIVRSACNGDTFKTLDGQDRALTDSTLMICDGKKPVGIAGIMGGENSMIKEDVTDVLLEAACFDGTNIRLTSKKVGLRTDASGKFEKGLDPNTAKLAMDRACQLIEEIGAGEVVGGEIDVYPNPVDGHYVSFCPDAINQLLGTNIAKEEMITYLNKVDLTYCEEQGEVWVPSWRQDIFEMNDLAEEVARFYGYDKIPTTLPKGETTMGQLSELRTMQVKAGTAARLCGFSQAMNYSFESPKVFDKLRISQDSNLRQTVTIQNPLGEDFSIMRTVSLNGMMTNLSTNYNRRNKNVRLFEFGNIYLPKTLPMTELPQEEMELTLGMYGEGDFFDLKGMVHVILTECGVFAELDYEPVQNIPFLHPGKAAVCTCNGEEIAYLGEVHPQVIQNYGMKGSALVAVIHMNRVLELSNFQYKYQGLAKYPAVTRDLSLLVPKQMLAKEIENTIKKAGGSYLESIELFDIYEGNQVLEGHKSMAYSLVFRAKDKTLEENEIVQAMGKIMKALSNAGVELRQV